MKAIFKLVIVASILCLANGSLLANQVSIIADTTCLNVVLKFASDHRIQPKYYAIPCYIAPCPLSGVHLDTDGHTALALKNHLMSVPETRKCVASLKITSPEKHHTNTPPRRSSSPLQM